METKSRSFEEVKADILRRAGRVNPFERTKREDVEEVLAHLSNLDPEPWGVEWGKIGARYEALGAEQEKHGKKEAAGRTYYQAYEYYRIGRYPVPSSPEKMSSGSKRVVTRISPGPPSVKGCSLSSRRPRSN